MRGRGVLLKRCAHSSFHRVISSYSMSPRCMRWLLFCRLSVIEYNWISATILPSSNVAPGCSRIRGQWSRYFCWRLKGRALPIAKLLEMWAIWINDDDEETYCNWVKQRAFHNLSFFSMSSVTTGSAGIRSRNSNDMIAWLIEIPLNSQLSMGTSVCTVAVHKQRSVKAWSDSYFNGGALHKTLADKRRTWRYMAWMTGRGMPGT